jgi:Rod binding domain-containing protein
MSALSAAASPPASLFTAHEAAPREPKPDSTPQTRKLYKECQQFEGLLIANLWNEMEDGESMTGLGSVPGAGAMQGLGIESAANSIATSGGLGIARMLYDSLAPRLSARGSDGDGH